MQSILDSFFRHFPTLLFEMAGIFLPFKTWGRGPLTLGKKSANLSNWENLIESSKQYVNILAFLLPAQQSISSFFVVNLIYYNRRRNRIHGSRVLPQVCVWCMCIFFFFNLGIFISDLGKTPNFCFGNRGRNSAPKIRLGKSLNG